MSDLATDDHYGKSYYIQATDIQSCNDVQSTLRYMNFRFEKVFQNQLFFTRFWICHWCCIKHELRVNRLTGLNTNIHGHKWRTNAAIYNWYFDWMQVIFFNVLDASYNGWGTIGEPSLWGEEKYVMSHGIFFFEFSILNDRETYVWICECSIKSFGEKEPCIVPSNCCWWSTCISPCFPLWST